jgi:hypothetical protein
MLELDKLTHLDFSPYLHQTFRMIVGAAEPVELELIEVIVLGRQTAPPGALRRPFSLTFRGPKDLRVPQRIYRLEHEQMGAMELFLVPLGPDAEGMRYEAIFN